MKKLFELAGVDATKGKAKRLVEMSGMLIAPADLKNIGDVEVDGIDTRDAPDFADAYIASAVWKDTGAPLSDAEIDYLNDAYREFVYDQVQRHLH